MKEIIKEIVANNIHTLELEYSRFNDKILCVKR